MTPGGRVNHGYKSRYWANLNGLADSVPLAFPNPTGNKENPGDRENELLDIIGAYDFLLLQGISEDTVVRRLGLKKSRDELVRELDAETERRVLALDAAGDNTAYGANRLISQPPPALGE